MADLDFTTFFKQYEALVRTVEQAFERVKVDFPQEVTCQRGCSDCCHALFDLTVIEALYINHHFNRVFDGPARERLLEKANRADRKIYKIKKSAYDDLQKGKTEIEILGSIAMERVRCPLLDESDTCELYDFRPITCRLYGIPTASDEVSHTCGKSGFVQGKPYPTVKLDQIHQRLYQMSADLVASIPTRFSKMADILVPLSMVLQTIYDEEYLGICAPEAEGEGEGKNQS